jgi:hypothetical protein
MHFQQLEIGVGEVAPAAPAYPGIDLERLGAIAFPALFGGAPRIGDDTVEASVVGSSLAVGHDVCDALVFSTTISEADILLRSDVLAPR